MEFHAESVRVLQITNVLSSCKAQNGDTALNILSPIDGIERMRWSIRNKYKQFPIN